MPYTHAHKPYHPGSYGSHIWTAVSTLFGLISMAWGYAMLMNPNEDETAFHGCQH